ncbi:ZN205 protein, partial [Bucorvus abyssinicus]|nr:ZN205 protein [Bucorvus abyssinicus]
KEPLENKSEELKHIPEEEEATIAPSVPREQPNRCPECRQSFPSSSELVKHRCSHPSARPFVCSDCGKRFGRSTMFLQHRLIHTG